MIADKLASINANRDRAATYTRTRITTATGNRPRLWDPLWLVAAVAFVLFCILPGSAAAAPLGQTPEPGPGVISGRVMETTNDLPVGGINVRLRRWQETEGELPSLESSTDEGGEFIFESLDTAQETTYWVEAEYQGVVFASDLAVFEAGVTRIDLPLNVYEATDSDEAISIERLHLIVMLEQPGLLSVLEFYQWRNDGRRVFTGRTATDGSFETVRVALPVGAEDVALQDKELGFDVLQRDGDLISTQPILPGNEAYDLILVYYLPYQGDTASLNRVLYYDTGAVNALVVDAGISLESDRLTYQGQRVAQGQTFLQYTGQDVHAGEVLPVEVAHLDQVDLNNISPEPAPEAGLLPGPDQPTLLVVMLVVGVLLLGTVLVFPDIRRRKAVESGSVPTSPEERRRLLIETIARLDLAFQQGRIDRDKYDSLRGDYVVELAGLWRRQPPGEKENPEPDV